MQKLFLSLCVSGKSPFHNSCRENVVYLTKVRAIPDVINGQLVGYNFIYGLQLENELKSYENVDFARCFDDCNTLQALIIERFIKSNIY